MDDPKQVDVHAERLVVEIRLALEGTQRTGDYTRKLSVLHKKHVSITSTATYSLMSLDSTSLELFHIHRRRSERTIATTG